MKAAKEKIEAKKEEVKVTKESDKEKKALTSQSMHKLRKAVISYDHMQYILPMHSFKLAWSTLVHSHKNEKNWTSHIMCSDLFKPNSCEHCRKEGWEFEPREVKTFVGYCFNTVGEKRSFNKVEDGVEKTITYFLNPAQVIELPARGDGEHILKTFDMYEKDKLFTQKIWGIYLKKGEQTTNAAGKTKWVGRGFELPETVTPEEMVEKLGKEGFEPCLPSFAQKWASEIAEIYKTKGEDAARDEVFRYILPSFDNAQDIADIKGIDLPQKPERQETSTGVYS